MKGNGASVARASLPAVLALVVALTLAACGGSSSTTTAPSTTIPPSTSPSTTTSLPVETTTSTIPLPTPTIAGTIAFTRGVKDGTSPNEIWVVNTDGTGLKMLAGGEFSEEYPRWSPDGSKIVYVEGSYTYASDLFLMNADGSGKVQLTKNALSARTPIWSPDGAQIVFSNMESDNPHRIPIYIMNADGSGLRRVTNMEDQSLNYVDYWPMWATDGKIYFYRLRGEDYTATWFSVSPDGSGLTKLMELGSNHDVTGMDGIPQWLKYGLSPDATRVALHDLETDRLAIQAVNGDGASVTLLDPVAAYTADHTVDVAWSPDGKALAIAGLFDASQWVTRLMIVNADGTGLSAVPGVDAARDPSWRPK